MVKLQTHFFFFECVWRPLDERVRLSQGRWVNRFDFDDRIQAQPTLFMSVTTKALNYSRLLIKKRKKTRLHKNGSALHSMFDDNDFREMNNKNKYI